MSYVGNIEPHEAVPEVSISKANINQRKNVPIESFVIDPSSCSLLQRFSTSPSTSGKRNAAAMHELKYRGPVESVAYEAQKQAADQHDTQPVIKLQRLLLQRR